MHALLKQHFISSPSGGAEQSTPDLVPDNAALSLRKNQHLHLQDGCGWTVHAVAGTLWITQDGDVRDVVLEAGQSFVLDRSTTALLSPMPEAQVLLERGDCRQTVPRRAARARPSRVFSALRGLPA